MGCDALKNGKNIVSIDVNTLKKLAEPLMEFVNKQDPYLSVTVRQGSVIVARDEMCVNTEIPD